VGTTTWRSDLDALVARGVDELGLAAVATALEDVAVGLLEHPDAPVEPFSSDVPVLGVDACKGGWVGVRIGPEGRATVHTAKTVAALLDLVREHAEVLVVAVDIPIGLPDAGDRQADVLARQALPGKASSVFTTLTRAAYEADTYADGRAANVTATGGTSASAQAYALRVKLLEVDAWLRTGPTVEVIEVHPELSFARMAGAPLLAKKRDPEGVSVRRDALASVGLVAPPYYRLPEFAEDDLLDACAAAWSAARYAAGQSESLPAVPEVFSDGLPAAIRV